MKYICDICHSFEYDVEKGDEQTGLVAGTAYENIPENWRCPVCNADKSHLVPVEVKEPSPVIETVTTMVGEKTVSQYRDIAREKLMGNCSVNKTCDGDPQRLCMGPKFGETMGLGGEGQGKTFSANYKALDNYRLKMRLVKKHAEPQLETSFLGKSISMPVLVPSVSGVKNMNNAVTEEEFQKGLLEGARLFGTIGMSGQTPSHADRHPGLDHAKGGVLIFKPQGQEKLMDEFKQAEQAGAIAVGVDLDGCGSTNWAAAGKAVYRKSQHELRELVESTSLPVLFKGIMCLEDAQAVVESGAKAMVISNHGGRVMDYGQGVAEVLPEIASHFKSNIKIIVDGACRTGYDVIKYLALGADFAMIGRPIARMSLAGGAEAVKTYLEFVKSELRRAMLMTGCDTVDQITKSILINTRL
ncbi:alpha-hydroxy-acid oxidizing protein [bacterium]|nr:alpha-hydroxy-acid oxidizing protein [bacterium]